MSKYQKLLDDQEILGVAGQLPQETIIDRMKPYMDEPEAQALVKKVLSLKGPFLAAVKRVRELGGDIIPDNPLFNEWLKELE